MTKQQVVKKSNDIHESKKIGMQIEKLNVTLINNIKQTLNQISGLVNQQFQEQETIRQELSMIQQLIDQLETKRISSMQAKDNTVMVLQKKQNLSFDQQFIGQLNQVIEFYTSSQLIQTAITLQENIENIFKQKSKIITYYQTQPISAQQQKPQIEQQHKTIDRSLTPTYTKSPASTQRQHSIEQKQVTSSIISERSTTLTPSQLQKSYEFKSGMLFKDQMIKTEKQESIKSNTSSSLISRSSNFPKYEKQFVVKAHDKRISSIQFSENCVFTCSYDKLIRAWDLNTGKLISTLEGHTREITCLRYSNFTLASGGVDKVIRIWKHHPRWQLIGNLKGHQALITSLEFLNEKQLLSGSEDQSLKVWDLEKQFEVYSMRFECPIYCLKIENKRLYVGGGNGFLYIYQCSQLEEIKNFELHQSSISIILLTNLYIITIDMKGIIKISDFTYQCIKQLKDDYEISSATYIQQYNMLAVGLSTASGEGKICFYSLDTFRKIKEIYDNGSGVGGLAYCKQYLWSGHDNKRLECLKFGS